MAKLALCIGINNYPGTGMDLKGCVNDANDWAAELTSRGFSVAKLIDAQATKAGMVAAFKSVIGDAASGDVVVITYSGHGTYQPDTDGEEEDGLDEALCPHDIEALDEALTDDEIHTMFQARKPGVRLVLISDSCHSGTVNREVRSAAAGALPDTPMRRFMPAGNWMSAARMAIGPAGSAASSAPRAAKSAFDGTLDDPGDVLLAGCQEGEDRFSYDARIMGRANGAFTFYALKALRELPDGASYAAWHKAITPDYLPTGEYDQIPQIGGSDEARAREIFS